MFLSRCMSLFCWNQFRRHLTHSENWRPYKYHKYFEIWYFFAILHHLKLFSTRLPFLPNWLSCCSQICQAFFSQEIPLVVPFVWDALLQILAFLSLWSTSDFYLNIIFYGRPTLTVQSIMTLHPNQPLSVPFPCIWKIHLSPPNILYFNNLYCLFADCLFCPHLQSIIFMRVGTSYFLKMCYIARI